jgi:hypothetical protein
VKGDNANQKARIFPTTKDGSARKRPVVSGEQLLLQFGSNIKMLPGIVEVIQVSDNALHDWIKPLVPKKLLNVAQNIVFLGFLMSNGILEQMKSFGQPIIDKLLITERNFIEKQLLLAFLMSDDTLDQVKNFDISDMKNFLTSGSLDIIFSELESVKADLSPELQDSYLQWKRKFSNFNLDETLSSVVFSINKWKDLCSSIYRDGKEEFSQIVVSMIRKDMLFHLKKNIESEKEAAEKLQEQQFKNEQ